MPESSSVKKPFYKRVFSFLKNKPSDILKLSKRYFLEYAAQYKSDFLEYAAQYKYEISEKLQAPIRQRSLKRKNAPERIAVLAYEKMHSSVVHSVIRISNYKTNYVTVYTNKFIYAEMKSYFGSDMRLIDWSVIPNRLSLPNPLYKKISERVSKIDDLDKVIIPSGEYYHYNYLPLLAAQPKHSEVIAMVHNVNFAFDSKNNEELYQSFSHADSYAVPIGLMGDEIRRRNLTDKKVYEFPQIFRGVTKRMTSNNRYSFVITGSVEKERKNYDLVLDVFGQLKNFYDKIELVLLGRAANDYAKGIIEQFKKLEENGLSVRHFNDFVPTDQFEKYMQSSDYILGPINVNFSSEGYNEIYGVTKMTGTVSDMIEYARPAIVPSNLKMPEELESSTVFYQSPDDLREQIVRLLDSEVYQKLSACALENSRKYTPENFYI